MILQEALRFHQNRLQQAGVANPSLDVRLLAAHALGCDRASLIAQPDRALSVEEQASIDKLIARRCAREPVARILGQREFWGLPFHLNEATLEPRPDSETLVAAVLENTDANAPCRILDLGTGTGCLLLAVLHSLPKATGLGIDKSPRAVQQAAANAAQLGLDSRATFQTGDWFDGVNERFDVILSNPPYITTRDIDLLEPDVRDYDPRLALDGGQDGLDPYIHIIPELRHFLNPHGAVFFEVGHGQSGDVANRLAENGFTKIAATKDLGGIERVITGSLLF